MNPPGNPVQRRAGEVARGLLIALAGRKPIPMHEVQELTNLSRSRVLQHLAILQEKKRIAGYTSAKGILRVWTEERE